MKKALFATLPLIALMTVTPVLASGYAWAPYGTSWTISPWPPKWTKFDVGRGVRWVCRFNVNNVGSFALSESKLTVRVLRVKLKDGTWGSLSKVKLLNAGGTFGAWQLVSLGTIKPGKSRSVMLNWVIDDDVQFWVFRVALRYLT